MTRKDELEIIIRHLVQDVVKTGNEYRNLLEQTIVKNGKEIEKYNQELKELKVKDLKKS